MTLLGHGVHIAPPQPIEEVIAWHTVPAQLSALRKMLRDAETSRQGIVNLLGERLDELERTTKEWFECVRLEVRLKATQLGERLDSLEQAGQAQFIALKGRVIGLGEAQTAAFAVIDEHLDRLDKAQQARLAEERKLTTQRLEAMHGEFEGVQVIQQVVATSLSERLDRLEQAPLKRFWRWLTRQERKNGSTL